MARVWKGMRFTGVVIVALLLVACSRPAGSSPAGTTQRATPTADATSRAMPSAAAPGSSAAAPGASSSPVGAYLPHELDGVQLHTFAVAADVTGRLGQAAGVPLELSYASEHGARFIQTIAIRAPGTDAGALASLFPAAAFPPDGATAEVTPTTLADEPVIAVADPATTARLGTYYLLTRDDVLIVIEAFSPDDAADMVAALPEP
jgi:hypothetical protein